MHASSKLTHRPWIFTSIVLIGIIWFNHGKVAEATVAYQLEGVAINENSRSCQLYSDHVEFLVDPFTQVQATLPSPKGWVVYQESIVESPLGDWTTSGEVTVLGKRCNLGNPNNPPTDSFRAEKATAVEQCCQTLNLEYKPGDLRVETEKKQGSWFVGIILTTAIAIFVTIVVLVRSLIHKKLQGTNANPKR